MFIFHEKEYIFEIFFFFLRRFQSFQSSESDFLPSRCTATRNLFWLLVQKMGKEDDDKLAAQDNCSPKVSTQNTQNMQITP